MKHKNSETKKLYEICDFYLTKPRVNKLCKSCKDFIVKFRPWNERKFPKIALVKGYECKKCRMSYTIYKGMIHPIRMATPAEAERCDEYLRKETPKEFWNFLGLK